MAYKIKLLETKDLKDALKLVEEVFMEFEGIEYSEEGINNFKEFIREDKIKNGIITGLIKIWGCYDKEKIIGVMAMRNIYHICLLFVDKDYHKRGIGRSLIKVGIRECKVHQFINEITVNASPYGKEFYHKIGFVDTDKELLIDGMRFTPMKFTL